MARQGGLPYDPRQSINAILRFVSRAGNAVNPTNESAWIRQASFVLIAVLVVIASPVLIPVALALHERERRAMRAIAETTRCKRCGATLGAASLEQADQAWADHVAALHRDHPGVRFRLLRGLWALCAVCAARYGFNAERRVFTLLDGDF
jgi:hypothetical protein